MEVTFILLPNQLPESKICNANQEHYPSPSKPGISSDQNKKFMRKLKNVLTGLVYVVVFLFPVSVFAQVKTLSGQVTDIKGNPIAGASVVVTGSTLGAATDISGRFKISTQEKDASLVISAVGFKSKTFKLNEVNGELNVKLEEDIAKLEEVLVTGLATTVKRKNLANAVATVSAKELNGIAPAQTFDAALNGKVPGAYITSNSGAPGGGSSVKLRGITSIYGNTQPLYVVDGVFMNNLAVPAGLNAVTAASSGGNSSNQDNPSNRIADLRPEDIESIEILKGASAAAIYGSKAATGVILITTKRGKQGNTTITFSQDLGFVKVSKLLGVRQFTSETAASLSSDSATSELLRQQFITARANGKIYDYEKEMYGNTGFITNSVLSLSGGNEKTRLYFSAASKDEDGIIERTGYRNKSLRLNIDHRINNNVKIGIVTNYINSSADRGLTGNDNTGVTYGIALSSTPGFAELHPDANGIYPRNQFAGSNPIETKDKMTNNESVNRFVAGVNIDALLFKENKSFTKLIA
jgi:TonB-dependent SusC/RagA subfamily outer membrane receptor